MAPSSLWLLRLPSVTTTVTDSSADKQMLCWRAAEWDGEDICHFKFPPFQTPTPVPMVIVPKGMASKDFSHVDVNNQQQLD